MTSLIDVIFLLLLFFMLTSTFSKFSEVPLAVQARGLQFSWKHTLTSVEANISLCSYMALAVLMRLWVREPSKRTSIAVLVGMQRLVAPVIASYIRHAPFDEAPAASVLAQLMTMLVFAFAAFRVTSS